MNKKLIIWDFDGVIADTEHLWVEVWKNAINERYNLNLTFDEAYKKFAGISPKSKIIKLREEGIDINEKICSEIDEDTLKVLDQMKITSGITEIFTDNRFEQCIATGGTIYKTFKKIEVLELEEFFNKTNVFTAEMVENGKPSPDLFLYSARKMGKNTSDCIVVEDSFAGITAAKNADMEVIAYLEHQKTHIDEFMVFLKDNKVNKIAHNSEELKSLLSDFIKL